MKEAATNIISGKDRLHGRLHVILGVDAACMNCAIRKENGLEDVESTKDVRIKAPEMVLVQQRGSSLCAYKQLEP